MNTRTCTCGGSNENCMFCFGTGVVERCRLMPDTRGTPPSFQRGRGTREVRVALKPCPICGVPVKKLTRHVKKVHPTTEKPVISLTSQPASVLANVPAAATEPPVSAQPSRKAGPNQVACPGGKVLANLQTLPTQKQKGKKSTTAVNVRETGRQSRAISAAEKKRLRGTSHFPKPGPPERIPTAVRPENLRNEELQQRMARALDATKEFAHKFREHGRYGSHPSHDDYSDEGRA